MNTDKEEKTQQTLLQELCGADTELHALLSFYLYANPMAAVSSKSLDVLIEEAEQSGAFRPALDKAIFEGAQNPEERERYVSIIQDLSSKANRAMEQAREALEKEGAVERAASLWKKIEEQRFMSERAGDILDVAAKFYSEKLLERGENAKRVARDEARRETEQEEQRMKELEETGRDARRQEQRKMGWRERREAKKRDKAEDLASVARKQTREDARTEADNEERRIEEQEETERDARRKERDEN